MMDLSAFSLEGKTVLVTGANTGIGQGIAVSIGRAGGRVIGVGRSSLDETAALLAGIGAEFVPVSADLSTGAPEMLAQAWQTHGPIDGLVNNAGIIKRADAADFTEADWDDVMDVNLKAMFFLCQAFGRQVFDAGRTGKIVNIASMLSFQGGIRVASYTASKHGALGITRLLANEWAARGIN
ncbi:MAG TPA: SDR family NAD(P)-dependent oxidoreductase, partial [Devosia sp.]|nr:SDR family NAD(P)-dependent oxidoreductase [Devosia sp.]